MSELELSLNEKMINSEGISLIRKVIKNCHIENLSFKENIHFCVYFSRIEDFYRYALAVEPISSINIFAPPRFRLIFTTETAIDNRRSPKTIFKNLNKAINDFDYEGLKKAISIAKKVINVLEGKYDHYK